MAEESNVKVELLSVKSEETQNENFPISKLESHVFKMSTTITLYERLPYVLNQFGLYGREKDDIQKINSMDFDSLRALNVALKEVLSNMRDSSENTPAQVMSLYPYPQFVSANKLGEFVTEFMEKEGLLYPQWMHTVSLPVKEIREIVKSSFELIKILNFNGLLRTVEVSVALMEPVEKFVLKS